MLRRLSPIIIMYSKKIRAIDLVPTDATYRRRTIFAMMDAVN